MTEKPETQVETVISKKRGRKPKNQTQNDSSNIQSSNDSNNQNKILNSNNIVFSIEETADSSNSNTTDNNILNEDFSKPPAKKRGRKPKGGKIIQQSKPLINSIESKPNVILHLKCSIKDLEINQTDDNIESFGFESCKNDFVYEIIGQDSNLLNSQTNSISTNNINNNNIVLPSNASNNFNSNEKNKVDYSDEDDDEDEYNYNSEPKEITKKLKILERNLHTNNISDKKSACFWCTHSFDNPPIYIPKCFIKESYHVYGCFCSPECATAYLLEENIESSTKFERYQLLNNIYCKIYDYKQNIKPAPNPYYMLDKYYGNLSIQEYRALLKNERLFLIVDKPLTRILPELHEYNDDFILNNKIIPSNTFKVKKKVSKQQTKNNILNERFANIQQ